MTQRISQMYNNIINSLQFNTDLQDDDDSIEDDSIEDDVYIDGITAFFLTLRATTEFLDALHKENKRYKASLIKTQKYDTTSRIYTECSICLDIFEDDHDVSVLDCEHILHTDCIKKWMERSISCPICRHDIDNLDDSGFRI